MFYFQALLLLLAAAVQCKEAAKAVDKKKQDKRGATSYTQVVHGSTGLDHVPGRAYHGGQGSGAYYGVAYVPVANYGYNGGYNGDVKTFTVTKEIPVPVAHPYPVAVEKRIPYPVNIAVAVPVERPVPLHLYQSYPVATPVAYAVSKPYPVATPVPLPVYVKGNDYGAQSDGDEGSGYNRGYSDGIRGYNAGGNGYNRDH